MCRQSSLAMIMKIKRWLEQGQRVAPVRGKSSRPFSITVETLGRHFILLSFKAHVGCDCKDHLVDSGEIANILTRTVAWSQQH